MTLFRSIKKQIINLSISIKISIAIMLLVFITQALLGLHSSFGDRVIGMLVIVYSVFLVYRYRNNISYALMFFVILYINWSIVVGVYLDPSIRPEALYKQFAEQEIFSRGIVAMLFFLIVLYIGSFRYRINNSNMDDIWSIFKPNQLVKWVCFGLFVATFLLAFSFVPGGRGTGSALDEYKVIFLLFGGLFSDRRSKFDKCLWTIIALVSSVVTLISGNRASILNVIVILFLLWYQQYFSIKKIFMLFIPFVLLMTFIGVTRGVYSASISFADVVAKLANEKLTTDTFTFAYVPSLASEALIGEIPNAIELFFKNIVYIFLGGGYGNSTLSFVTVNHYKHFGGYIAPTYMDIWFGWLGSLITGILTQWLIQSSLKKKRYAPLLSVWIVAFVFRWYVYNYMLLFRACFLLMMVYLLVLLVFKLMRNMSVRSKNGVNI